MLKIQIIPNLALNIGLWSWFEGDISLTAMKLKVIFFASLSDFTGQHEIELENCESVSRLNEMLNEKYSGFNKLNFAIAVNKSIVNTDYKFSDGDIVALLPPFSGG